MSLLATTGSAPIDNSFPINDSAPIDDSSISGPVTMSPPIISLPIGPIFSVSRPQPTNLIITRFRYEFVPNNNHPPVRRGRIPQRGGPIRRGGSAGLTRSSTSTAPSLPVGADISDSPDHRITTIASRASGLPRKPTFPNHLMRTSPYACSTTATTGQSYSDNSTPMQRAIQIPKGTTLLVRCAVLRGLREDSDACTVSASDVVAHVIAQVLDCVEGAGVGGGLHCEGIRWPLDGHDHPWIVLKGKQAISSNPSGVERDY